MKKVLCCLMAAITLFGGVLTTVSCGGGGNNSSPTIPSVDENKVTLKFTKKVYNIENGQTVALEYQFTADGKDVNPALLTFESTDPTIATVDQNGVVTGVSGGRAYVNVSYGSKTAKATINVTMRENAISVSDESCTLLVGATKQVAATVKFGLTEVTDPALTWVSSNPAVATVQDGLITAIGVGEAEITVTYENVSAKIAVTMVEEITADNVNSFNEKYVNIYGRTYLTGDGLQMDIGATSVEVGFVGKSLKVTVYSTAKGYMRVCVDGDTTGKKIELSVGTKEYEVASGLTDGLHTVRIIKVSQENFSRMSLKDFTADGFFAIPENKGLKIEFIGSGVMSGYGVYGSPGQEGSVDNSDASRSFAYLAAQELNANYSIIAYTSIAIKIKWWAGNYNMETMYRQISATNTTPYAFNFNPDVIVINMGSVESSYIQRPADGDPSYSTSFQADYEAFLRQVRTANPNAYIICLYGMIHKNPSITGGIMMSIEALGDDRIVLNPFDIDSNTDGAINHPNSQAQKTWGADLAAYIRSLEL